MVKNTLTVGRIEEGFVLDHIQAGRSMDIYKYLHLDKLDCCVAIIKNAKSNIKKFTDPVVDSWEGEGAKAFKKVYKKLKTELNDEEENLSNVKKDLENIKASYEGWDQELSNQFKGDTPSSKNEKKK